MSRLPFEAFLALRYLRPRRTFVSVITVISIIGVLLGVAVLIIVIAVMSGFDQEWRETILGFNGASQGLFSRSRPAAHQLSSSHADSRRQLAGDGCFAFDQGQALLKSESAGGSAQPAAPYIFGVDPASLASVNVIPTRSVAGSFDVNDKGLLVGRDFAAAMGLAVGDRVAIYSSPSLQKMQASMGKTNAEVLLPEDFTVRGVFDVGFPDYNTSIVVTSLEDARELQALPEDSAQFLQVKLRDLFAADEVARQLQAALGPRLKVLTWREDSPAIFDALAMEKNTMFYLLFFIMIVAAFGIVNCQITFVVQKTREIGILKALGATQRQILWIFLSQSIIVGVLGVGLGLGAGLLALAYRNQFLDLMRKATHIQLLPANIYHVYELPASIQSGDVAFICGMAFVTCVLAGLFPAWKASRLQPVEALRHE